MSRVKTRKKCDFSWLPHRPDFILALDHHHYWRIYSSQILKKCFEADSVQPASKMLNRMKAIKITSKFTPKKKKKKMNKCVFTFIFSTLYNTFALNSVGNRCFLLYIIHVIGRERKRERERRMNGRPVQKSCLKYQTKFFGFRRTAIWYTNYHNRLCLRKETDSSAIFSNVWENVYHTFCTKSIFTQRKWVIKRCITCSPAAVAHFQAHVKEGQCTSFRRIHWHFGWWKTFSPLYFECWCNLAFI